jgi:glycosyltransferase A (GT-A) superfamily protein (DUF2064 family)
VPSDADDTLATRSILNPLDAPVHSVVVLQDCDRPEDLTLVIVRERPR